MGHLKYENLIQKPHYKILNDYLNNLSQDELMGFVKSVRYKSWGFPYLLICYSIEDNVWDAGLRNPDDWENMVFDTKHVDFKQCVIRFLVFCVHYRLLVIKP